MPDKIPGKRDKQRNDSVRLLSLVTNIGVSTIVCLLVGIGLGWLLDKWLGTSPLFLIVLLFLGIGAAFKNIYDISKTIK